MRHILFGSLTRNRFLPSLPIHKLQLQLQKGFTWTHLKECVSITTGTWLQSVYSFAGQDKKNKMIISKHGSSWVKKCYESRHLLHVHCEEDEQLYISVWTLDVHPSFADVKLRAAVGVRLCWIHSVAFRQLIPRPPSRPKKGCVD